MDFQILQDALISPQETFKKAKKKANLKDAVKYAVISSIVAGLLNTILLSILEFPTSINSPYFSRLAFIIVFVVLMSPIIFLFILFSLSIISFILSRMAGGKGDFTTHTYLVSLFFAPLALLYGFSPIGAFSLIILRLSTGLLILITVYYTSLVIKETHEFKTLKATIVSIMSVLLFFASVVAFGVFIMLFTSGI